MPDSHLQRFAHQCGACAQRASCVAMPSRRLSASASSVRSGAPVGGTRTARIAKSRPREEGEALVRCGLHFGCDRGYRGRRMLDHRARQALLVLLIAAGASIGKSGEPPGQKPSASRAPLASTSPPQAAPLPSGTAAQGPEDGGETARADHTCGPAEEQVDGGCCPVLQACMGRCCNADEQCDVYQCYRPILCGPGLPACPEKTHCEDYEAERIRCVSSAEGRSNAERCARARSGAEWLSAQGPSKGAPRARGICFPELPPHRMGALRWYRSLGWSAMAE
jgi:hypothetical protein